MIPTDISVELVQNSRRKLVRFQKHIFISLFEMRITIVIVYPHRRAGGATRTAGGVRPFKLKSAEGGGSEVTAGIIFGCLN